MLTCKWCKKEVKENRALLPNSNGVLTNNGAIALHEAFFTLKRNVICLGCIDKAIREQPGLRFHFFTAVRNRIVQEIRAKKEARAEHELRKMGRELGIQRVA